MAEEPMTLVERLRNPSRVNGGGLDEGRTLIDMAESANAHDGERILRRALVNEIRRLDKLIREANEVCRSAHSIASRKGAETNWEAFIVQLSARLADQHAFMYPKDDGAKEPPGHPIIRAPDTRKQFP